MRRFVLLCLMAPIIAGSEEPNDVLFSESFDDAELDPRGWYDGQSVRIVPEGQRGSCIEYERVGGMDSMTDSSAKRHLFEPTDEIFLRFDLRHSRDRRTVQSKGPFRSHSGRSDDHK